MDWTSTRHLAPTLVVHYPSTNETGDPVRLETNERDGAKQIHALADDRESVYFEVVVFGRALDLDRLIAGQIKRFAQPPERESPWHSAAEDRVLQAFDTREFRVGWTHAGREMTRTMVFFDTSTSSVRLIYDHRSPLNIEIRERLEFGL